MSKPPRITFTNPRLLGDSVPVIRLAQEGGFERNYFIQDCPRCEGIQEMHLILVSGFTVCMLCLYSPGGIEIEPHYCTTCREETNVGLSPYGTGCLEHNYWN